MSNLNNCKNLFTPSALTPIKDIKLDNILPVKCSQNVSMNITDKKLSDFVDTLKDLFNPNTSRVTGRTTAMALAFVSLALESPNKPISIFDHTASISGLEALENKIKNIIENYIPNGLSFELTKIDSFRASLTFIN